MEFLPDFCCVHTSVQLAQYTLFLCVSTPAFPVRVNLDFRAGLV